MDQIINGTHEGSLRVNDETRVSGLVTGSVTVEAGGFAHVAGTVAGTLSVLEGGEADVTGVVGRISASGRVTVAVGAIVDGRVLGEDGRYFRPTTQQTFEVHDSTPRFVVHPDGSLTPE